MTLKRYPIIQQLDSKYAHTIHIISNFSHQSRVIDESFKQSVNVYSALSKDL